MFNQYKSNLQFFNVKSISIIYESNIFIQYCEYFFATLEIKGISLEIC